MKKIKFKNLIIIFRYLLITIISNLICLNSFGAPTKLNLLTTTAEISQFQKTGRYDEVQSLCSSFQRQFPKLVSCLTFGKTPENRPLVALVANSSDKLTAQKNHATQTPVILIQGGIHSGESDGKDAGFIALRELLTTQNGVELLKTQTLLFIPVVNVDGHERFEKWNRPNQNGPEETGWRTNSQNYNLNRDYVKAETKELAHLLKLINQWDPLLSVDLHTTNGAKFQHDIAFTIEPSRAGDLQLRSIGKSIQKKVLEDLSSSGSFPLSFYPEFSVQDDPTSEILDNVFLPRYSNGYFLTKNRFGVLVETHSWKTYRARVESTKNTIISLVTQVSKEGKNWLNEAKKADQRSALLNGVSVPLNYKVMEDTSTIDFKGYAYERKISKISGSMMTQYDDQKPANWKVKIRSEIKPDISAQAPLGGYIVPAAYSEMISQKLKIHGIDFKRIAKKINAANLEAFRIEEATFSPQPKDGRQRVRFSGQWKPEQLDINSGSLFVPINQAKSVLLMTILEPTSPDSLGSWGFFNSSFEQVEYMEPYVAEDFAQKTIEGNPEVAEEFKKKLDSDPKFKSDPSMRLDFFYKKHPSWDDRINLYPIRRTNLSI